MICCTWCHLQGCLHLRTIVSSAGYERQKQVIEDGLLGPLTHPEVYEAVAAKTRKSAASNRPRAVLFEGPPGCGKTSSARYALSHAPAPSVTSLGNGATLMLRRH